MAESIKIFEIKEMQIRAIDTQDDDFVPVEALQEWDKEFASVDIAENYLKYHRNDNMIAGRRFVVLKVISL